MHTLASHQDGDFRRLPTAKKSQLFLLTASFQVFPFHVFFFTEKKKTLFNLFEKTGWRGGVFLDATVDLDRGLVFFTVYFGMILQLFGYSLINGVPAFVFIFNIFFLKKSSYTQNRDTALLVSVGMGGEKIDLLL